MTEHIYECVFVGLAYKYKVFDTVLFVSAATCFDWYVTSPAGLLNKGYKQETTYITLHYITKSILIMSRPRSESNTVTL